MLTYMQTRYGRKVDFLDPDPKTIEIADIGHALARVCRFGGHVPRHYSVAQHSVYVSQLVRPDLRLAALLHDATEAYVGDMVAPLKELLPEFKKVERAMAAAIGARFGVRIHPLDPDVKRADLAMLVWEAKALLDVDAVEVWGIPAPTYTRTPAPIVPWPADLAEKRFVELYHNLAGEYARGLRLSA